MTMTSEPRLRRSVAALALFFALATSGALLSASPAGAISPVHLAGGIVAGGTALMLHKNWDRISAKLSKAVDAVAGGDPAKARELEQALEETPGRLVTDAFSALSAIEGGAKKLRATVGKIKRFVGDRRAALATGGTERTATERRILKGPLPEPPPKQRAASRAVPHCPQYGVRDSGCSDDDRAETALTDNVQRAVQRWKNNAAEKQARTNRDFGSGKSAQDDVAQAGERYRAALDRSLGNGSEPSEDSYRAALDSLDRREATAQRKAASERAEREAEARREAARQRELLELERLTRVAAEAQERERRARAAERRQREAARASQPSYTYEDPGPSFGEMLGQALQGWADNLNRMRNQLEGGTTGPNSGFTEEGCWPGTYGPNCEHR